MFWTAVLPQLEVITMNSVANTKATYGQVRLWGSVGFICLTVMVGKALDSFSTETPVHVSIGVLALLFVSTLFIRAPAQTVSHESAVGSIWAFAKQNRLLFYFCICVFANKLWRLLWIFALYMRDLGYSGQQTGFLLR